MESYFISYAHADKKEVFPILKFLGENNIEIWYDEGIPITKNWEETIISKLDPSRGLIVFISNNLMRSQNCKNEILDALDNQKMIIPIYIENVVLDQRLMFKRLQDIQGLMKHELKENVFYQKLLQTVKTKNKKKEQY